MIVVTSYVRCWFDSLEAPVPVPGLRGCRVYGGGWLYVVAMLAVNRWPYPDVLSSVTSMRGYSANSSKRSNQRTRANTAFFTSPEENEN